MGSRRLHRHSSRWHRLGEVRRYACASINHQCPIVTKFYESGTLLLPFGVPPSFFDRFGLLLTAIVSAMATENQHTKPAQILIRLLLQEPRKMDYRSIDAAD
jgi:hypothetical protein